MGPTEEITAWLIGLTRVGLALSGRPLLPITRNLDLARPRPPAPRAADRPFVNLPSPPAPSPPQTLTRDVVTLLVPTPTPSLSRAHEMEKKPNRLVATKAQTKPLLRQKGAPQKQSPTATDRVAKPTTTKPNKNERAPPWSDTEIRDPD